MWLDTNHWKLGMYNKIGLTLSLSSWRIRRELNTFLCSWGILTAACTIRQTRFPPWYFDSCAVGCCPWLISYCIIHLIDELMGVTELKRWDQGAIVSGVYTKCIPINITTHLLFRRSPRSNQTTTEGIVRDFHTSRSDLIAACNAVCFSWYAHAGKSTIMTATAPACCAVYTCSDIDMILSHCIY